MKRLSAPAIALIGLTLLATRAFTQDKDARAALDGEWELVEMVFHGTAQDFAGEPERMRFRNGEFWHAYMTDGKYHYDPRGEAFTVRPGGELDIERGDGTIEALYELKEGTLRIVWREEGDGRPAGFGAVADPKLTLRVLKRIEK